MWQVYKEEQLKEFMQQYMWIMAKFPQREKLGLVRLALANIIGELREDQKPDDIPAYLALLDEINKMIDKDEPKEHKTMLSIRQLAKMDAVNKGPNTESKSREWKKYLKVEGWKPGVKLESFTKDLVSKCMIFAGRDWGIGVRKEAVTQQRDT